MCQQQPEAVRDSSQASKGPTVDNAEGHTLQPFPWDIGVFDAHCHPTDTMASIEWMSDMKARGLTVMSTREQDQDLVNSVAVEQGIQDKSELRSGTSAGKGRMIPSFGWHPWFSYQLYDDTTSPSTYDGSSSSKRAYYDKILAPAPSSKDASFSDRLPDPRPLSQFLKETRERLERHPLALIGEIGLDKAFRLPQNWTSDRVASRDEELTPGGREGRTLSPHRVQTTHQAAILQAQLRLAGEMGRAVSVHGVQAHGILYDTIAECWKGHEKEVLSRRQKQQIDPRVEEFSSASEDGSDAEENPSSSSQAQTRPKQVEPKPYPPRICLHSFSGHTDALKQYLHPSVPAKLFFSFSIVINWGTGGNEKTEEAIRAIPDDRILIESDLHTAGDQMDQYLEEVCRKICQIKGWDLRRGVEQLAQNWRDFVFG